MVRTKTAFTFGLVKGSSDLIGWTGIEITLTWLGTRLRYFTFEVNQSVVVCLKNSEFYRLKSMPKRHRICCAFAENAPDHINRALGNGPMNELLGKRFLLQCVAALCLLVLSGFAAASERIAALRQLLRMVLTSPFGCTNGLLSNEDVSGGVIFSRMDMVRMLAYQSLAENDTGARRALVCRSRTFGRRKLYRRHNQKCNQTFLWPSSSSSLN